MTLARLLAEHTHVLLDVDGPVCGVFEGAGATNVTRRLATTLRAHQLAVSPEVAQCGHTITIVSNNSAAAVATILATHGLTGNIRGVVARTDPNPDLLKPAPHLVTTAVAQLDTAPRACVLIGDSPTDITAARAAGTAVIAYANRPGKRARSPSFDPTQPSTTWRPSPTPPLPACAADRVIENPATPTADLTTQRFRLCAGRPRAARGCNHPPRQANLAMPTGRKRTSEDQSRHERSPGP